MGNGEIGIDGMVNLGELGRRNEEKYGYCGNKEK